MKTEELAKCETMELGDIRVYENPEGTRVVIHKAHSHSQVTFLGEDTLKSEVEEIFNKNGMGNTAAKLSRPDTVVLGKGAWAEDTNGEAIAITANWLKPEEFAEEILLPLFEADLISEKMYLEFSGYYPKRAEPI